MLFGNEIYQLKMVVYYYAPLHYAPHRQHILVFFLLNNIDSSHILIHNKDNTVFDKLDQLSKHYTRHNPIKLYSIHKQLVYLCF